MSQPDYPHSQDSGKLQTLAVEVGKIQSTLEGLKESIDEMKAAQSLMSSERLAEARDYGALRSEMDAVLEKQSEETKWRYTMAAGVIVAIALRFLK